MLKTKLTPVRYPGGKSNALKRLDSNLRVDFKEYREPFFGGGSVGLYLMQMEENKGKRFWVNDLFYPVYCFWKSLHEDPNNMVKIIQQMKNEFVKAGSVKGVKDANGKKTPSADAIRGSTLHENCRKLIEDSMKDKSKEGIFLTGCYWYILNKLSYSGMAMIGSYAPLAWDQNFTDNCIANLPETSALLHTVDFVVTNSDYSELLIPSGNDVFIFLDPPYKIPHSLYGKDGDLHEQFNHQKFCSDIAACQHKWLITYNDDEDLKQWLPSPPNFHKEWELQYTMKAAKRTDTGKLASEQENVDADKIKKSGKKGKELLIANYPLKNVPPPPSKPVKKNKDDNSTQD